MAGQEVAEHDEATEAPSHIVDTVRLIADMHSEHHEKASSTQRMVESTTARIGSPVAVAIMTIAILGWVGANQAAETLGFHAVDPSPFPLLATLLAIISLYLVVMILATQRRDEELDRHRERMILELALLNEQKTTKIIQLLEESRRDNPFVHNRVDAEADAMARPATAQSVIETLNKSHEMASETIPPSETKSPHA